MSRAEQVSAGWAATQSLLAELVGLVAPVSCAGCGAPDVGWCDTCAVTLCDIARRDDAWRLDRMDGAPVLPVWTAASYSGPVRAAIPAWKDGGRGDLTSVMVAAVRRVAAAAAPTLADAQEADARSASLLVVPVPSRRATVRRRGRDLVAELAGAVADELGAHLAGGPALAARLSPDVPSDARPHRWRVGRAAVLRRSGGRDQVGLGARARGRVAHQISVTGTLPTGAWAVLVDDVVTTGATLAACHDALVDVGVPVLAAFAVAGTPRITRPVLLQPTAGG